MIANIFRCEFRSGRFLKPVPIIVFLWFDWDAYWLLFFYYAFFTCAFQQESCPTRLLYNSGCKAYKYLCCINLVYFIYYQFYMALFLAIRYLCFQEILHENLEGLYYSNVLLIWAFIIGNALSNTDLVGIKNSFQKAWSYSFVFSLSLFFIKLLLKHIEIEAAYTVLFSVAFWFLSTYLQRKMNFPLLFIKA